MPRSDRARLIDLVKFKGVVDGSRKSGPDLIRYIKRGSALKGWEISCKKKPGIRDFNNWGFLLGSPLIFTARHCSLQSRGQEDIVSALFRTDILVRRAHILTSSKFVYMNIISPLGRIKGCKSTDRPCTNDKDLLSFASFNHGVYRGYYIQN